MPAMRSAPACRSWRVGRNAHHRAVAIGIEGLDGVYPGGAAAEAQLAHEGLHRRIPRRKSEAPVIAVARQAERVEALERLRVAGERCAHALDEGGHRRIALERVAAPLPAIL